MTLEDPKFAVVNVGGLTPSNATINMFSAGIADGGFYNSSYIEPRNIVLTIVPKYLNLEQARIKLYQYFKPKYKVRLYFTTATRDVYIDGYVETFEGSLYSQSQAFQISVLCPQPFFSDVNPTIVGQVVNVSSFTFPFSTTEEGIVLSQLEAGGYGNVVNKGEETTGVIIQMNVLNNVVEPTIYNTTTRQKFTFEMELIKGDFVVIDTRRGHKTIILTRDGVSINLMNKIAKGSSWFALPTGDNVFTYTCAYGVENLQVSYIINPLYGGV